MTEWTRMVARHGRLVVDLARHPSDPTSSWAMERYTYVTLQQQKNALAELGPSDESWSTEDLPIVTQVRGGNILCQGIALSNRHAERGIQIANDSDSLGRLACSSTMTTTDRRSSTSIRRPTPPW